MHLYNKALNIEVSSALSVSIAKLDYTVLLDIPSDSNVSCVFQLVSHDVPFDLDISFDVAVISAQFPRSGASCSVDPSQSVDEGPTSPVIGCENLNNNTANEAWDLSQVVIRFKKRIFCPRV